MLDVYNTYLCFALVMLDPQMFGSPKRLVVGHYLCTFTPTFDCWGLDRCKSDDRGRDKSRRSRNRVDGVDIDTVFLAGFVNGASLLNPSHVDITRFSFSFSHSVGVRGFYNDDNDGVVQAFKVSIPALTVMLRLTCEKAWSVAI
jgi:hypothetical protein